MAEEKSIDQLVEEFRKFRNRLEICQEKKQKCHSKLLTLIEEELLSGGGSSPENLQEQAKLKEELSNLQLRCDAIEDLLTRIRLEVIEKIPQEIEGQLAELEVELGRVREEEAKEQEELAKLLAEVAVSYEKIKGRTLVRKGDGTVEPGFPTIKINGLNPLGGESKNLFFEEVQRLREKNPETLKSKLNELAKERTRLRELKEKDPRELAERLLGLSEKATKEDQNSEVEPLFRAGKLSFSKFSKPIAPEYQSGPVPKVGIKSAKMG